MRPAGRPDEELEWWKFGWFRTPARTRIPRGGLRGETLSLAADAEEDRSRAAARAAVLVRQPIERRVLPSSHRAAAEDSKAHPRKSGRERAQDRDAST